MARIAINGFGRIGRAAFKIALDTPDLEVVAINDIVPTENLAYLLKYDTVYGRYDRTVEAQGDVLIVGNKEYKVLHERDPAQLPWGDMKIDIVLECTGLFTREEDMQKHLDAGANFVILSAPSKSEDVPTVVYGSNVAGDTSKRMISCASCTTNCITPVVEIVGRRIGFEKAIMTTVHAYTSSQSIVDSPSKSIRRGRAGAANFVPTSTGAAVATTRALPDYKGLFDGVAIRGPVPCGSIADVIFVLNKDVTVDEVNKIFREEAQSDRYKGVVGVTDDPYVSSDIIGDSRASVIDLDMTMVVGGNLLKAMAWYDNEWGYSNQLIREAVAVARSK